MNTKYINLINQTFDFPQEEFTLKKDYLRFHDVDLNKLVETYGTPLKFTYLPKISDNINKSKVWFENAIKKYSYNGNYNYCYCTKSSHFKHVLNEALKNDIHIETSSAFEKVLWVPWYDALEYLDKDDRSAITLYFDQFRKQVN